MKKIVALLLGSILLAGTVACENNNSKTTASAPGTSEQKETGSNSDNMQNDTKDAQSDVRRNQLNSDIRAREQRSNASGGDTDRADSDLSSEVRSKLEANLPTSQLTVEARKGSVVVSGTVNSQAELNKIEPLAKQIKGVQSVDVVAQVMSPNQTRKQ